MKVALVILHADPARGGAERYTIDLADQLASRGHEVKLLAGQFGPNVPPPMRVPLDMTGWTRSRRYARFLDSLSSHLSQNRYDIVHAMLPIPRCDVYHPHAGMAARNLRRLSIHFNARRRRMAAVERQMLQAVPAPVVLSLSELSKREITDCYDLPAQRLLKLPNGVDSVRFDPAKIQAAPIDGLAGPVALFISQNFALKGLQQAIEASARLRETGLTLLVIGRDDPARYQAMAQSLGAHVKFLGPIADPRPYYKAARFFVLPTRHDQCSLVVLEALGMGVPVISTRFNGACELMTDGLHGFVLDDPADSAALADAMRKLLDDDLHRKMSQACLDLRPHISTEHHVDRLLEIYSTIVRAKNAH